MLSAFGNEVVPIGFRRGAAPADFVEDIAAIDLGQTFDADFRQRIAVMLRQSINLSGWAPHLRDCDVIIARNLEMLLLGTLAGRRFAPRASLVYEALDIHRLLLSPNPIGKAMRRFERVLLRGVDLLIVSSPAFLREYFVPMQALGLAAGVETLVVENKLLSWPMAPKPAFRAPAPEDAPPWQIGWFGMIRCRKSLDYLSDLAQRRPGLTQLTIRGRPSYTEFTAFDTQIAQTPGFSFGGPYQPFELAGLYGGVHFNWAIDFFEEGANSRWLLPNRIYEGGAYGAVPVAIDGTETAAWLQRHGVGVVLPALDALEEFLLRLSPQSYLQLKEASRTAPQSAFLADDRDSARLLGALDRAHTRRVNGASRSTAELDFQRAGTVPDDTAM